MHRVFQTFIDRLSESVNLDSFRDTMADVGMALDLKYFAYLSLPHRRGDKPHLISTYPSDWTTHYLRNRYERLDPVIIQALAGPELFQWGPGIHLKKISTAQYELLDEASSFGIRHGFTVPIHDGRGPVAAFTFAAGARRPAFERRVKDHGTRTSSRRRSRRDHGSICAELQLRANYADIGIRGIMPKSGLCRMARWNAR